MVDNPSNNYHNYLSSRVQSSMFLRPTNLFEINNIISQLNPRKGKRKGPDGISAKFIIIAKDILTPILIRLFNACFELVFSQVA